MILELLTPLMLATSPMTLVLEPTSYNHEQQVSKSANGGPLSYTSSGTRTYDFSGKPNDSDND
jgi:hypothetical protein